MATLRLDPSRESERILLTSRFDAEEEKNEKLRTFLAEYKGGQATLCSQGRMVKTEMTKHGDIEPPCLHIESPCHDWQGTKYCTVFGVFKLNEWGYCLTQVQIVT